MVGPALGVRTGRVPLAGLDQLEVREGRWRRIRDREGD